jgi:hypothetical protein
MTADTIISLAFTTSLSGVAPATFDYRYSRETLSGLMNVVLAGEFDDGDFYTEYVLILNESGTVAFCGAKDALLGVDGSQAGSLISTILQSLNLYSNMNEGGAFEIADYLENLASNYDGDVALNHLLLENVSEEGEDHIRFEGKPVAFVSRRIGDCDVFYGKTDNLEATLRHMAKTADYEKYADNEIATLIID